MAVTATTAATTPATTGTAATTSAATGTAAARATFGTNFDTFLTLLTTQLKNQSPTDPLDTNQMTQQLVQFASVEQQISMNRGLEQLIALQQASGLVAAAPMVGRRVEVEGDRIALQDGAGTIRLPAAGTARTARVVVQDDTGRTLRESQVTLGSAAQDWRWDGRDSAGTRRPDGAYRVVVTGADSSGGAATVPFTVLGTVTGTERVGGAVTLRMGAAAYGFDKVRSVLPASS